MSRNVILGANETKLAGAKIARFGKEVSRGDAFAISIVAEILMVRLGGSGAPLRMDARRLERLWSRLEARDAAS